MPLADVPSPKLPNGGGQSDVLKLLDAADIANGAVNDVPAVAKHPQLAARQRWSTAETPGGVIPVLLPPHGLMNATPARVPALGEHTAEILAELDAAQT